MQDFLDKHRNKLLLLNIIAAHVFLFIAFLTEFNSMEALANTAMVGWLFSALLHFIVKTSLDYIITPAVNLFALLTSAASHRNTSETQPRPLP